MVVEPVLDGDHFVTIGLQRGNHLAEARTVGPKTMAENDGWLGIGGHVTICLNLTGGETLRGADARVYNVFPLGGAGYGLPVGFCNSKPMAASNSCLSNGFSKSRRPPRAASCAAVANSWRPVIRITGRVGRAFLMIS